MIPKKISEAVQERRITPANAYVYLVLRELASGNRSIKVMRSVLADAAGYECLESISEHLKSLAAAGLIQIKRSQYGGNEHLLLAEDEPNHWRTIVVQEPTVIGPEYGNPVREQPTIPIPRNTPEYHQRLSGAWEYTPEAAAAYQQRIIEEYVTYPELEDRGPL